MTVRRTPSEALEMFRRTGQTELAAVLAGLIEGPRRADDRRAVRRRELFPEDVADFLDAQDRRRDAARRLPPVCPFGVHTHVLGCHDPAAMTG